MFHDYSLSSEIEYQRYYSLSSAIEYQRFFLNVFSNFLVRFLARTSLKVSMRLEVTPHTIYIIRAINIIATPITKEAANANKQDLNITVNISYRFASVSVNRFF